MQLKERFEAKFKVTLGRFESHCRVESKQVYLGLFDTAMDAHQAWEKCKRGLILERAKEVPAFAQWAEKIGNSYKNGVEYAGMPT